MLTRFSVRYYSDLVLPRIKNQITILRNTENVDLYKLAFYRTSFLRSHSISAIKLGDKYHYCRYMNMFFYQQATTNNPNYKSQLFQMDHELLRLYNDPSLAKKIYYEVFNQVKYQEDEIISYPKKLIDIMAESSSITVDDDIDSLMIYKQMMQHRFRIQTDMLRIAQPVELLGLSGAIYMDAISVLQRIHTFQTWMTFFETETYSHAGNLFNSIIILMENARDQFDLLVEILTCETISGVDNINLIGHFQDLITILDYLIKLYTKMINIICVLPNTDIAKLYNKEIGNHIYLTQSDIDIWTDFINNQIDICPAAKMARICKFSQKYGIIKKRGDILLGK
jgi:hypothetical protein